MFFQGFPYYSEVCAYLVHSWFFAADQVDKTGWERFNGSCPSDHIRQEIPEWAPHSMFHLKGKTLPARGGWGIQS